MRKDTYIVTKLEKPIELSSMKEPIYLCTWNDGEFVQIHNRHTFKKEYETTNMRFDTYDDTVDLPYESKHNVFNTMNELFDYFENEEYGGLGEVFYCDNFEITRIK